MNFYQPRFIKRPRRTKAQIEQLERQIQEVYALSRQSIRHCWYQMTNPRLPEPIEKTEHGYRQVWDRVTKMRRSGALPYRAITDSTRYGYHTNTYGGMAEFLRSIKSLYRADLWQKSRYYCEVWVESRSIAGVLLNDCKELAVSLYPCGGFTSITLAYDAAEDINNRPDSKPVIIFYVGDYDPAGVLIDVALERELRRHLRPNIDLTFKRIGITAEQVEKFNLPTKPRKERDRRSKHILETVEAEAMPAHILRRLVRDEIEALLPSQALLVAKEAERSEQAYLEALAQMHDGDDEEDAQ